MLARRVGCGRLYKNEQRIARIAGRTENANKMRRGWDSNPRKPCDFSGFQDRRIRPLCHPSEAINIDLWARSLVVANRFDAFAWCQRRCTLVPPTATRSSCPGSTSRGCECICGRSRARKCRIQLFTKTCCCSVAIGVVRARQALNTRIGDAAARTARTTKPSWTAPSYLRWPVTWHADKPRIAVASSCLRLGWRLDDACSTATGVTIAPPS